MMVPKQRLCDVFPLWMIGEGIFSELQELDVPWKDLDISASLDLEYFGNYSGSKPISPLIRKIKSGTTLTDNERLTLATAVVALNGASWGKEWATLEFEYDPIENYSMREVMTNDVTQIQYGKWHVRTDDLSHTKSGTDTIRPNTTETRTDNLSHAKTGTDTLTPNTTETRTDNLSHAKTGTDTLTPNTTETRTDNLSHAKTGTDTLTPNTTETRTDNLNHEIHDRESRKPDLTETTTPNLVNNTADGIFGFNSSGTTSIPSADRRQTATGTNIVTKTGSEDTTRVTEDTNTGTSALARTGTETTQYNITESDTGTSALARTGTETTQYNTTESDTGTSALARTGTETTQYNTTESDTGTSALARTGTETTQYDTTVFDTGTVSDRDSGTDAHVRHYNLTRSGNIGVTTSQQMIESERKLWLWRFFYDVVFPDIDRILTLSIY